MSLLTLWNSLVEKIQVFVAVRSSKNVARNTSGPVLQGHNVGSLTQVVINFGSVSDVPAHIRELLSVIAPNAALPGPQPPALPDRLGGVRVTPGDVIGVVKAFDLEGSRVHLPFQITNDLDEAIAVRTGHLTLNGWRLTPKQFYETDGKARAPDPAARWPNLLASKATATLRVEFENLGASPVFWRHMAAELSVEVDGRQDAIARFEVKEQRSVKQVLDEMQEWAVQHQSATAFDLPISPG